MSDVQTYRVQTVYDVRNDGSAKLNEITRSANEAARATQTLSTAVKALGAGFVGGRIFGAAKNALIGYNRSMEDSRAKIAGMLTMFSSAGIEKSWDRAGLSMQRFEQMAKKSSLTTKELVDVHSNLVRPLIQAGAKVSDIEKMSFGVANAAKAFGMEGTAAFDVEQMVTGRVGMKDRFAKNILGQEEIGLTADEFNKMGLQEKVATVNKALTTKAITDLAEKQSQTMSGTLSTLEDNFDIMMGKIGLPIFKAITEEVKGWNVWIDKNDRKITEFGKTVGSTLVTGFKTIKSVFGFMYDHSDKLILVAKAYAAIRLGNMLGGSFAGSAGNAASGIGGLMAWLKGGTKGKDSYEYGENGMTYKYTPGTQGGRGRQAVGGLKGAAENAGLLGTSLGVGVALGTLLEKSLDLSSVFSRTKTINGQVLDMTDSTTKKYAALQRSMNKFDAAVINASERLANIKGAGGSKAAAQLLGSEHNKQAQLNIINELRAGGMFNPLSGKQWAAEGLMRESGLFDEREMAKIMRDSGGYANQLQTDMTRQDMLRKQGVAEADAAWEALPSDMKASLDRQEVTAKLMENYLRHNQNLSPGVIAMTLAQMGIDDPDSPFGGSKTPKQTVNITIQRVMAKDPNRWLADMDDMVAKRTRAKTRAKKGWKNTPR